MDNQPKPAANRAAAASRAAGAAARQQAYESGFAAGFKSGFSAGAEGAYEIAFNEGGDAGYTAALEKAAEGCDSDSCACYTRGHAAGREANDSAAYKAGLEESRAVVADLKRRLDTQESQ